MLKKSHHFLFLALFLALLSIGLIWVTEISVRAQTSTVNTNETEGTTAVVNKEETINLENTETSKTETNEPVACSYTYSSWGPCSAEGIQTRSIISKTPSGCYVSAEPILKQSCTYVVRESSTTSCTYTLSDWSTCDSSGIQNRKILSRTPSGCLDSKLPVLQQTCDYATYSTSETSTSSVNKMNPSEPSQDSSVTPAFSFLNINGNEVISGLIKIQGTVRNAYRVEFYLVPADSNTSKYLGLGKRMENNVWEYPLNSPEQPNGAYYLKAKIKNAYGSYESDQKMLVILNPVEERALDYSTASDAQAETVVSESENSGVNLTLDQTSRAWQEKYFKSESCLDQNICGGMADPDKDGINNNDEFRYGTSPANPDSDADGFLDGDEVKNGFNPLKASPGDKSDKMIFESPKESGEIKKDFYQVNQVELVSSESGKKNLRISGKGIPNSFVTLYIYSDPIILTVKTDQEGNWSYEIDKEIEDGEHQVYVAVTDNTGKITAKSEPLFFTKTAEAVSVVSPSESNSKPVSVEPISSTKNQAKNSLAFLLALIIGSLALVLASLGLYKHHQDKKEKENLKIS